MELVGLEFDTPDLLMYLVRLLWTIWLRWFYTGSEPEPEPGSCACVVWVTELPQQVEKDEDVGEEAPAAPGGLDVVTLLHPLEPHADPILQEGADQAEPGHVGEVVFGHP